MRADVPERGELPLFRDAAVAARRSHMHGGVVLSRPFAFSALTGLFAGLGAALLLFAYFGSYTANSTLRGRVITERGVIEIGSAQAGTIIEKRVAEGQRVTAGAALFVVSSDTLTEAGTAAQRAIVEQLVRRRRSLDAQIASTRSLEHAERAAIDERLAATHQEAESLEQMIATVRERLALATQAMQRLEKMRARGFLAEDQWVSREVELLEQRAQLQQLERERSALARLAAELEGRATTLGLQYANELAELQRAVGATDLEIVESESRRAAVVASPESGTATGVVAEVGQAVERGAVLARLVPDGAALLVELFAPSRAVGFVAPGSEVRLRYAAFPYQKFGHARGRVATVSLAALETTTAAAARPGWWAEPMYRVTVSLESQTLIAYGQPQRLLPGMEVEADVLLETRRLYEWVFEPLYALVGTSR
jgi:membrane fusion protein